MILSLSNESVGLWIASFLSIFAVISILVDGIMMIIGAFIRDYEPALRVLNIILGILIVPAAGTALSFGLIGTFMVKGVFLAIALIIAGTSLIVTAPTKEAE